MSVDGNHFLEKLDIEETFWKESFPQHNAHNEKNIPYSDYYKVFNSSIISKLQELLVLL